MIFVNAYDKIAIITSSTATLEYYVSYAYPSASDNYGHINTVGTTTINASFISPDKVKVNNISIVNTDGVSANTVTIKKIVGTTSFIIFKATLSAGDNAIFNGDDWKLYDSTGKIKVTYGTGGGGGGSADGGNIIAAGTDVADSTGTVIFSNANGISFGLSNSSVVTASYTVPATTQFQHSSLMSNYLGNTYSTHTHSQYVNNSVSSQFQQTSAMSNYLGTTYTSHTHSQYVNNSVSSIFQQTSLMSDYLGTGYTTHTHAQYLNTSVSSLFQQTSLMTNYVNTSVSTLFQQTSLMTNYLGTNYTTHTHPKPSFAGSNATLTFDTLQFGNLNGLSFYISNSSLVGSYTTPSGLGATYTVSGGTSSESLSQLVFGNSNGASFGLSNGTVTMSYTVPVTTNLQQTSLMSDYLGTNYTTHTHSQYLNVSQSSLFEQTSQMTDYLGTAYTTHTHSQYVNNSQSSLFQATSLMSNYLGNTYTTHTHSQYVNTSVTSNFLTTQTVQPVAASASNGSFNFGTLKFADANGVTFATSTDGIRASVQTNYIPSANTSLFQHTSQMSDYLGTGYTTHTHSQYVNNSQSSLFQQTSLMTNYLDTGYTTHTHSQYVNNSQSSLFQQTSLMSNYFLSSLSSNLQAISLMSNYLGTSYTSHTHSQYVNVSQSSLFQQTSLMSNYLTVQSTQPVAASGSNGSFTYNTLSFGNLNGMSFYTSNGSIVASYTDNGGAGGLTNINFSAGTTSNNLSALTLANSNGVSFGLNGSVVTASHNGLTSQSVQTQNMVSLLGSTGNISLANSNGITFGGNASTITASHNGLTSQSNQALSGSNGSFAFQTASFGNLNGMSFYSSNGSMVGSYTVPSIAGLLSAVNLSAGTASNNLSAFTLNNSNGISFGLNGSVITASHNGLTIQTIQPVAASGSNGSFSFNTLSFGNLNGITFYTSNGSIVASYTDGGGGGGLTNINLSAGTLSNNLSNFVFADSNNISFGLSGSTITASINAGAGGGIALANSQTTYNANTVYLSEAGALTINSGLGQSFQFSVPNTSSLSGLGNITISSAGNTINFSVAPHIDITKSGYNPYADIPMVAVQQGNGTLQLDPDWFPDVAFDRIAIPMAVSNATNSSGSHTVSYWVGLYTRNSNTLSLYSSASASTAMTMSGTAGSYSFFSGMRLFTIGMSQTLTEGQYWVGFLSRTTSGGANGSYSNIGVSNINSNFVGLFGQSNNTTYQMTLGRGVYSATTNAMPNSIGFSQIRGSDSVGLRPAALMFVYSTI